MTMLTFSYKKHYIHCKTDEKGERIYAQIIDNPDASFSTFETYLVKSIRAAKLLITKHVKAIK